MTANATKFTSCTTVNTASPMAIECPRKSADARANSGYARSLMPAEQCSR